MDQRKRRTEETGKTGGSKTTGKENTSKESAGKENSRKAAGEEGTGKESIDEDLRKTVGLFEELRENFKAPEDLTVSEWADKYRILSPENTAEAGRWRTSRVPYMKEVMNAFTDPRVKQLIVVASSQISKTETILNMLGYMIDQDPGPALYTVPTKDFAEDFSKRRLAPMIRDTKQISRKVADSRSRDSNNTITKKTYPGGMISLIGSNSATDLAGTPARYVFADEIDRWSRSAGAEGDPWSLLERRTTTFYNAKMVAVSTPTIKNHSKIAELYELGTREKWCAKCPHCGEYHYIDFDSIRFKHEQIESGGKLQFTVSDIYYCCPECGGASTESQMKRTPKKWIAETPEAIKNGCRSFWINGFYSPWNPWERIILRFLEANAVKDIDKLKTVYNTLFGELWENRSGIEDAGVFLNRLEDYGAEIPNGVLCLTMGVDTQDDRLEYEVVGHGFFGETWGIEYGRILGKPSDPEVWAQLDQLVEKRWEYANGATLKISLTFVDMGGHYSQEVKENCAIRQYQKVFCIKGANSHDAEYTGLPKQVEYENPNTHKKGKAWLYMIGVDAGKEHIMSALRVEEPGAKYCHFPKHRGYDEAYFNALLSERLTFSKNGKPVWEKIHTRNEALDCRNYANAAFRVLNPDMDRLRDGQTGEVQKKEPVKPVKKRRRRPDIYSGDLI